MQCMCRKLEADQVNVRFHYSLVDINSKLILDHSELVTCDLTQTNL